LTPLRSFGTIGGAQYAPNRRTTRKGSLMQWFLVPPRLRLGGMIVVAIAAAASLLALSDVSRAAYSEPLCVQHPQLCTEQLDPWTYEGQSYNAGHDEPSLLFYSNKAGSGNSNEYRLTLPTDPLTPPNQTGTGGTWNFQLHPAFWFGMAMCDDQSAPNPGV